MKQLKELIEEHKGKAEFRVNRVDMPGDMDTIIKAACDLGWGCYLLAEDGATEAIVFTRSSTVIF